MQKKQPELFYIRSSDDDLRDLLSYSRSEETKKLISNIKLVFQFDSNLWQVYSGFGKYSFSMSSTSQYLYQPIIQNPLQSANFDQIFVISEFRDVNTTKLKKLPKLLTKNIKSLINEQQIVQTKNLPQSKLAVILENPVDQKLDFSMSYCCVDKAESFVYCYTYVCKQKSVHTSNLQTQMELMDQQKKKILQSFEQI